MKNNIETSNNHFYHNIKTILQEARDSAYKQVNFIMVEAYWHIGQQIVEEEQKGEDRAKYGGFIDSMELISKLAKARYAHFAQEIPGYHISHKVFKSYGYKMSPIKVGGLIIEDDYDSELAYYNRPIPSLQGLDKGENVAYLGTFAKALSPSIRVGVYGLALVAYEAL